MRRSLVLLACLAGSSLVSFGGAIGILLRRSDLVWEGLAALGGAFVCAYITCCVATSDFMSELVVTELYHEHPVLTEERAMRHSRPTPTSAYKHRLSLTV